MTYLISSDESSDGIILENDSMTVLSCGIASDTTVNSGGKLNVSSGGAALNIVENGGAVGFEDAAQFASLSGAGAFDAFSSRKVFEESGSGILAGL